MSFRDGSDIPGVQGASELRSMRWVRLFRSSKTARATASLLGLVARLRSGSTNSRASFFNTHLSPGEQMTIA
jgi:hypothetical protein